MEIFHTICVFYISLFSTFAPRIRILKCKMIDFCKTLKSYCNLLIIKHLETYISLIFNELQKTVGFPSSFRVRFVARHIPLDLFALRF